MKIAVFKHMNAIFKVFTVLCLVLFFKTSVYASSCKSMLSSNSVVQTIFTQEALSLWERIEQNFNSYPVINRDATREDTLKQVEEFRRFAISLNDQIYQLDAASKIIFEQLVDDINIEINKFVEWYSSETRTAAAVIKDLKGLVGMSSRIKSHYFEAKVFVLLNKSGYKNIRHSIKLHDLRRLAGAEDQLSRGEKYFLYERRETEIDFIASKDGVNYLIEVKSFIPVAHRRFFRNLDKAKNQMLKRREFLNLLGLSSWKTVLVFQYDFNGDLQNEYFSGVVDAYFGLGTFDEPTFLETVTNQ